MKPSSIALSSLAAGLILLSFAPAAPVEDKKDAAKKPVIAVFPIGGQGKPTDRDRAALALRLKLDRLNAFEVLDGAKMMDLAAEAKSQVSFDTTADVVKDLASVEKADILVWGDLNGSKLRMKVLDTREKDAAPKEYTKTIAQPTDMRFAIEEILETVKGVGKFEHPNEEAVRRDPVAEELWKKNPNLIANGDFSDQGCWHGIYMSEYYPVKLSGDLPAVDKINIYRCPKGPDGKPNNVLAMNLSKTAAENNGLACLSDAVKIEPKTRYRLSFKYKSEGPTLHVFVKGYTLVESAVTKGKMEMREIYRRQVPPTGKTNGAWVEIVDELNPQHVHFPVQTLKVDLYAYLHPGVVMFDDVVLKAVGEQTRDAKDLAIKKPMTRPRGAKD